MPNRGVKAREAMYWLRREKLMNVIRYQFDGSYAAFSQAMGWPEDMVQRFFFPAMGGRRWPITDRAAREIERKLELNGNSLDLPDRLPETGVNP